MEKHSKINILLLIFSVMVLYSITITAFKNGLPTCKNYVMNTYLYLALSICFMYYIIINFKEYFEYSLFAFIVGIIVLITMSFIQNDNAQAVITHHMLWIVFLVCLSFMTIPIVKFSAIENIYFALFATFLIFLVMSMIVYIYPTFFESTFHFAFSGLLLALITIIIIELYYIFIKGKYPENMFRIISYIVIVVFSLFISYDTSLMFEEAKICRKYANYPRSSLKFILDLVNIFVRTLGLQSR
jgi:FtsH-binding integral membrane protein